MALTNKPIKSKYQVGETVYVLNGTSIDSGLIVKISTIVTNPLNDANGVQDDFYYMEGFSQPFKESEIFHSKNALLFKMKGDYLGKISSTSIIYLELINNSNISFHDLSENDYQSSSFENSNLEGVKFTDSALRSCSFQNCKLIGCDFNFADFTDSYFIGADLTNAILPSNANTKSTFKSVIGAGHWDPVTTIWTDGLPIG